MSQAYPKMPTYCDRAAQRFDVGERVLVGPAYQQGGRYACDGCAGEYFVVQTFVDGDYGLARHVDDEWCVSVGPTRLTRVGYSVKKADK